MAETTLASIAGSGTFPAQREAFTGAIYDAIQTALTAQNANNASLRTDINGSVQYASVPLTLTQLQHLHSAPVALVAAPGAGKMLELISATIEYVYGSAAFTIGAAGNMTISYKSDGSGSAASGTLACTGFFDQTSTTVATVEGVAVAAVAATAAVNQALALIAATADMTVGTGATGVVKLAYRVHSGL